MANNTIDIIINAKDEASKVLSGIGGGLESVGSKAQQFLIDGLAVGATAATGALASLVGISIDSINAAKQNEQVTAQLAARIKSTGGAAGLTAKNVLDMSDSLEKQTAISHQAITAGQDMLLTFTNIGGKGGIFEDTTKAVMDVATAMNQGAIPTSLQLSDTAKQLGIALNDPAAGLGRLKREGVQFTEQQKEQIKTLQKSGDLMGAQRLVLDELAKEFGGSAAASAQTFEGRLASMNNKITDVKEKLGEALIQGLTPFVKKISDFVDSPQGQHFVDQMTDSIQRFFNYINAHQSDILGFLTAVGKILKSIWDVGVGVAGIFDKIAGSIAAAIADFEVLQNKVHSNGLLSGLATYFHLDGFKAAGGPVSSGGSYVVGEKGPELFVPNSGGTIVPNNALNGGGGSSNSYTFNIGSVDSRATADYLAEEIADKIGRIAVKATQGVY